MHINYKIHRCGYNNLRSRCRLAAAWMPGCHRPWTCLALIRSARGGSPMNALMRSARRPNPIQWVQKKSNLKSNRIWWRHRPDQWCWGGARERRHRGREDWWPQHSNDGTFRSAYVWGGRRGWDWRCHPDLQVHPVDASGSYVPPPWTPSCHHGGARETLVRGMDRDGGGLGW
jgi:hypothetical protein